MGLGDLIKAKTGALKLDESLLNRYTIYWILRNGNAPFIITLPIIEQKRRHDSITVFDGNGHARTFDNPLLGDNTKMRKIQTQVQCNAQQLLIKHALPDGRHFFVDFTAVALVGKIKNGVWIEIHDGRRFIFEVNRTIKNDYWKALGFNYQFALDVFYNMFLNETWKKAFSQEFSCPECGSTFIGQLPKCPNCKTLLSYGEY